MARYVQESLFGRLPGEQSRAPGMFSNGQAVREHWNEDRQEHPSMPTSEVSATYRMATKGAQQLEAEGGFSINERGQSPTKGVMVAQPNDEYTVPEGRNPALGAMDYLESEGRTGRIMSDPTLFFGGWRSSRGDVLDLSQSYPEGDQAKHAISAAKEDAGWDVNRGEEVYAQHETLFPLSVKGPQWNTRAEQIQQAHKRGDEYTDDPVI